MSVLSDFSTALKAHAANIQGAQQMIEIEQTKLAALIAEVDKADTAVPTVAEVAAQLNRVVAGK